MISQTEITATAERLRELGLPDELNRWLSMTPTTHAAGEAARAKITKQMNRRDLRRVKPTGRSTVSTGHAANLDEAGKALLKEIKQAERAKLKEKFARLREIGKERTISKIGTKEAALREKRAAPKAKAKAATPKAPTPKAKKTQEAPGREISSPGGVRLGSKLEAIVGLLRRPEGCTTADVLAITGWPAVSMPQQAKAAGLKLKKQKDGRITRYFAQ